MTDEKIKAIEIILEQIVAITDVVTHPNVAAPAAASLAKAGLRILNPVAQPDQARCGNCGTVLSSAGEFCDQVCETEWLKHSMSEGDL